MLNYIRKKLSKTLYVQIWEHRLKVTDVASQEAFDEKPLVAIETRTNGQKVVSAIGNSALEINAKNVEVINPFSHPRVLFSDFFVGEKLLQHVFLQLHKKLRIRPSPIVVIHPMEKTEGGLTMIEERAFRELAMGAGASEIYIYQGSQLSTRSFDIRQIFGEDQTPRSRQGFIQTTFYLAILVVVILYLSSA